MGQIFVLAVSLLLVLAWIGAVLSTRSRGCALVVLGMVVMFAGLLVASVLRW
jgi:hypothetical protein